MASATPDRMDDLHPVIRGQPILPETAARDQFLVDLYGEALSAEVHSLEERGHVGAFRDRGGIAVDDDVHGWFSDRRVFR